MCWWGARGAMWRCGQLPPAPTIPLALPLNTQVLLQEPNPGIEYEFWLPRGHPQHSVVDTSALRQPQPRGAGSPPPVEPPLPTVPPRARGPITEPLPPQSPPGVRAAAGDLPHPPTPLGCVLESRSAPSLLMRYGPMGGFGCHVLAFVPTGRCGRCRPPKGRSQRIRHFCQSDFGEQQWGRGQGRGGATPGVMPHSVHPTPTPQCSEHGSWHGARWGRRCATRCRW